MDKRERALPRPPSPGNRFGEGDGGQAPLMADQMAMAAAQGKIEQFMDEALPDNDHARKLAAMMMGMSGMMPSGHPAAASVDASEKKEQAEASGPESVTESVPATPELPIEDIRKAVQDADVASLMALLKEEHCKRSGSAEESRVSEHTQHLQNLPLQGSPTSIEKLLLDRVMAIAAGNDLTPDWVITRALKLYVEGYEKTGRL